MGMLDEYGPEISAVAAQAAAQQQAAAAAQQQRDDALSAAAAQRMATLDVRSPSVQALMQQLSAPASAFAAPEQPDLPQAVNRNLSQVGPQVGLPMPRPPMGNQRAVSGMTLPAMHLDAGTPMSAFDEPPPPQRPQMSGTEPPVMGQRKKQIATPGPTELPLPRNAQELAIWKEFMPQLVARRGQQESSTRGVELQQLGAKSKAEIAALSSATSLLNTSMKDETQLAVARERAMAAGKKGQKDEQLKWLQAGLNNSRGLVGSYSKVAEGLLQAGAGAQIVNGQPTGELGKQLMMVQQKLTQAAAAGDEFEQAYATAGQAKNMGLPAPARAPQQLPAPGARPGATKKYVIDPQSGQLVPG